MRKFFILDFHLANPTYEDAKTPVPHINQSDLLLIFQKDPDNVDNAPIHKHMLAVVDSS